MTVGEKHELICMHRPMGKKFSKKPVLQDRSCDSCVISICTASSAFTANLIMAHDEAVGL